MREEGILKLDSGVSRDKRFAIAALVSDLKRSMCA